MPSDDPLHDEQEEDPTPPRRGRVKPQGVPHDQVMAHLEGGGPEPELDPVLDTPMAPPPEERGLPTEEPDLGFVVEGYVPVYNPCPHPFGLPYNGTITTVRGGGVDLVPEEAANLAVGVDNCGGTYSRFGLRRLYGPEARFKEDAKKQGLTIQQFVDRRNAQIRDEAGGAYASYSGGVPSIQGFAGMIPPPPEE